MNQEREDRKGRGTNRKAIGFFVIHKYLPVNSKTVQALPHTIPTIILEASVNTISGESMDQGMLYAQIPLWDSRHLSHQVKTALACFEIFTLWYNSFGFFESSINLLINFERSLTTLEQNCSLLMMDTISHLVAHDLLPQPSKSSHISHIRSSDILSCSKLKSIIIPKHSKTLAALIDFGSVSCTSKLIFVA